MNKLSKLILFLSLTLIIAACGQGANNTTEQQKPTSGDEPETKYQEEIEEEADLEKEESSEPTEPTTEVAVLDKLNLYFSDDQLMDIYRVEVDLPLSLNEFGLQNALQRWIQGPEHEGLHSLLPEGVVVQSVEDQEGVAYVSFSKELSEANLGSTGEAMLATQITMVVEQFGYEKVFVLIEGEKIDSLLGHLDWNEPFIITSSPEDFELYNY
ncbi:GerMN domain-containing protein [Anaerobacillus sp. CMMVII]|uniref:GerMN domain-containing protein n=1 Tax=Anaerobacillus sp. CMMVII TaxID=2755588 RepID=UPI0021B84266|nr:GerMN domain-containing protein [Anaerobacillus sp. CMMVII]MCT8136534.1 GerMN domain-containing protein [Anaerobacillus sp. CMMVII]